MGALVDLAYIAGLTAASPVLLPRLVARGRHRTDWAARFGRTADDIPTVIFWTGAQDAKALKDAAEGKAPPPPGNHSPFFAPQPEPALKSGVQAMTAGALELLGSN